MRHAGPQYPVVLPVLDAIDRQLAAGAVDSSRDRLDFAQPVARNLAEKRQRDVYVALRDRATAAFAPRLLRDGVQPRLHVCRRPRGEEQPRRLGHSLAARGSWLVSSTTASAAMPSPRPTKPSFSVVLALTLTASTAMPRSAARLARIAGMCGAMRGAWAMT